MGRSFGEELCNRVWAGTSGFVPRVGEGADCQDDVLRRPPALFSLDPRGPKPGRWVGAEPIHKTQGWRPAPLIGPGGGGRGPRWSAPSAREWADLRAGGARGRSPFLQAGLPFPFAVSPLSPPGWGWYLPPYSSLPGCGVAAILAPQLEGKRRSQARGAGAPLPPHTRASRPSPASPRGHGVLKSAEAVPAPVRPARRTGGQCYPRWEARAGGRGAWRGAGRGRLGAGRGRTEPPPRVGGR